jgi:hypothetical protein
MAAPTDHSGGGNGEPAVDWFSITPDDNNDLPIWPRGLYVDGPTDNTGTLTIVSSRGKTETFRNLQHGYHPLRPVRIKSTGTTVTGIKGLY